MDAGAATRQDNRQNTASVNRRRDAQSSALHGYLGERRHTLTPLTLPPGSSTAWVALALETYGRALPCRSRSAFFAVKVNSLLCVRATHSMQHIRGRVNVQIRCTEFVPPSPATRCITRQAVACVVSALDP